MAWGNGGMFVQPWINTLKSVTPFNLTGDAFKCALYNNTPVPNFSDAIANCVYLVGQWVTGNEVVGTNWVAGGVALTAPALTESPTRTLMWTTANVSVATTTLTNVYGVLIYDNTLATKYGVCAIPLPGAPFNTVAGTFGITWNALGILTMSLGG